jgi:hypothetical protein
MQERTDTAVIQGMADDHLRDESMRAEMILSSVRASLEKQEAYCIALAHELKRREPSEAWAEHNTENWGSNASNQAKTAGSGSSGLLNYGVRSTPPSSTHWKGLDIYEKIERLRAIVKANAPYPYAGPDADAVYF